MGYSRAQFAALAGVTEANYKSMTRPERAQLTFMDPSDDEGLSAKRALLLSLQQRFSALPDGQGIDNLRAASIVLHAMPEIDRNWSRIVESGYAMYRGRRNVVEIMVGRAVLPFLDSFADRIYARMNSENPGAGAPKAETRAVVAAHFPAVCGTLTEIIQVNGGVIIDLNVTSITRGLAVLLNKADCLALELPASFYPEGRKP